MADSQQGRPSSRIDEATIARLDTAARTTPFDLDLLRSAPVRDIASQIAATVALLEKMDHRALLSRQGVLSRLTGADIEARLEFELASEKVQAKIRQLRQAAQNGRSIRLLLAEAKSELAVEQERLEAVIVEGRQMLADTSGADEFSLARFERRLSNIMAMHAANILTIQQIALADRVLLTLLDRVTDVDTLLLPLWQRNALAVAHSAGREQRHAASEFAGVHERLIKFLKEDSGS